MVKRGPALVCEMPSEAYREYIGAIRACFSRHVRIDIERLTNEKGEKIVQIWSGWPEVVLPAIRKVCEGDERVKMCY